jgi:hypothetical protein
MTETLKLILEKSRGDPESLSQFIDEYLIPTEGEKKTHAEVSTPYKLRQEMLDKMPEDFWQSPKKVLEPCCGKGGFVVDIYNRFMRGLEETIKDRGERRRVVLEECLYFADISELNVFIAKTLLDPDGEYKLNCYIGDTLKLDIEETWGLKGGFEAVIGNPPYNKSKSGTLKGGYGGRSLWDKFVICSLDEWVTINGYLLFITPPSWRKPGHYLWSKMTRENQLVFLKCYSQKQGESFFGCSTRVDYYLIRKCQKYNDTEIIGQDEKEYKVDVREWEFLPAGDIDVIKKMLGNSEVIYSRSLYGTDKKNILPKMLGNSEIIYSSSIYDTRRKWVLPLKKKESREDYYERCRQEKYTYPIIHNMTKAYGNGFVYSNENKGHFGVKKVVLSFGNQYPYNDYKGEYGMSQICFGIPISNKEEGEMICKAINTDKFKSVLKYTKWSTFQTDWRMFKHFRAGWWRDFL